MCVQLQCDACVFLADFCGSCARAQRFRLQSVSCCGVRLPVALPHPGDAPLPALQRPALHRQGSRQVIDSLHPDVLHYDVFNVHTFE